jgi:hypothetical protein
MTMTPQEMILIALAAVVGVVIYQMKFSTARALHRYRRRFSSTRVAVGALGVGMLSLLTMLAFSAEPAVAATTVNLGAAAPYAVLAGSTVTNTGSSVITGDVGLSPGTSITGFPPGTASGTIDAADAASLAAQTSATAAEVTAAGETPATTIAAGTLGNNTLTPGVYSSASSISLTGPLTLDAGGDAGAVFIFQAGSTLTTASGSSIVLTDGAQACNVFWQVGSSATLGTTTNFAGTILAVTSATLDTGATLNGRVLAQTGAVTLNDNTVTVPSTCLAATPTTTTTAVTTTTTTAPPVTTTTTPSTTTSTVVPVGAPATGFGGTAGGSSPLGLIGLGSLVVAAGAATAAVRARRSRSGSSGDHTRGL